VARTRDIWTGTIKIKEIGATAKHVLLPALIDQDPERPVVLAVPPGETRQPGAVPREGTAAVTRRPVTLGTSNTLGYRPPLSCGVSL